jgi:hypothetical protein
MRRYVPMLVIAFSVPAATSAQVAEPDPQTEPAALIAPQENTSSETGVGAEPETEAAGDSVAEPGTNVTDESLQCPNDPLSERFTVGIGFSHWFGETFGSPAGVTTPAVTLGWIPLEWLELQVNYAISVVELTVPDGNASHVGFATLALMLRRALQVESERLEFAGGLAAGIVHTANGVRPALGVAIAARYMIRIKERLSLGPFIDARAMIYDLPESERGIRNGHSNLLFQIGAAAAF